MKRTLFIIALAMTMTAARAEGEGPWNANVEIGVSIVDNPKLEGVPGELDMDPGLAFAMGITYRVADWVRVGPEVGFAVNFIDDFGGIKPHSDAELFQMPMMVNVILEPPQPWVVKPFIGAGAGGTLSVLYSQHGYYNYWYSFAETDSDSEIGFSWQALAGVRWQIGENWDLALTYRYTQTEGQEYTFRDFVYGPDQFYRIGVDKIGTHLVTIGAIFSF